MKKLTNRFSVVLNYGTPRPTSWAKIQELMRSSQVVNICKAIAELDPNATDYKEKKSRLKTQLPAITVHASCFFDGKRINDHAIWNGMVCLEYDHLSESEIDAFYCIKIPSIVKFVSKSCGGKGIFAIIEVPDANSHAMSGTLEAVHQEFSRQILSKTGSDISNKIDVRLDLARLRFLPCYEYVLVDQMQDFRSDQETIAPYNNMVSEVVEKAKQLPSEAQGGSIDETTYKDNAVKIAKITNNKRVMLDVLPELGLSKEQRSGIINWAVDHVKPEVKKAEKPNLKLQSIDNEALPFPIKSMPKLIQTLVSGIQPMVWKSSATLCLLPALSAACGQLSYEDGRPLVFQVALYGRSQTGKTSISGKPASLVMDYISRNDNDYRHAIEKDSTGTADIPCPKVLPFTDTSRTQVMKYLKYAKNQTIMTYEGDLSSAIQGRESSHLDLSKTLRCGFDGETIITDYKDPTSVRGNIKARLSALVIGTPAPIFNYFNAKATGEGNSRRTILVAHQEIKHRFPRLRYSEDQKAFIYQELDYLQSIEAQTLFNQKIEAAAELWIEKKQKPLEDDDVLWYAALTPYEMYKRAAYILWALYHFDERKIKDCCRFAEWVAEYQFRTYINNTYNDLDNELQEFNKRKAPSTQTLQHDFNMKMLEAMPDTFTMQDIIKYRIDNNYPNDPKQQSCCTRWEKAGYIAKTDKKGTWAKIA